MKEKNRKYILDTEENKEFLRSMCEELLRFGHEFPSPGGSSYYLGDDGTPWIDRPRETWITSRMAHVYSIGSILGHEGSEDLADAALKGLMGELKDEEHGGWYAGVKADGSILPDKQCYAHAFVILAASSALLAGRPGAGELLEEALALYDRRFWMEEEGMSCDTWNTDFTCMDSYRGLNANMHTVEAFLAVADATGREVYRQRAGRIIRRVLVWARENGWRIPEHYDETWKAQPELNADRKADPFKPYGATPGHGIEWSRLITQWALSTYPDGKAGDGPGTEHLPLEDGLTSLDSWNSAAPYLAAAEELYRRAIADGWKADGACGIVYTTDWQGNPIVRDRMHWTLAEAINSSAVLCHVTGKEEYARDYAAYMRYLDEKVLDHEHGSWFHQLNEKNQVIGTVWPGKSDLYHALQATLIPYAREDLSIATAIRRREKKEK